MQQLWQIKILAFTILLSSFWIDSIGQARFSGNIENILTAYISKFEPIDTSKISNFYIVFDDQQAKEGRYKKINMSIYYIDCTIPEFINTGIKRYKYHFYFRGYLFFLNTGNVGLKAFSKHFKLQPTDKNTINKALAKPSVDGKYFYPPLDCNLKLSRMNCDCYMFYQMDFVELDLFIP